MTDSLISVFLDFPFVAFGCNVSLIGFTSITDLRILLSLSLYLIKKQGNGPIDAIFNALKALIPNKANLIVYQVNAITKGTDAQAEVNVRLEEKLISVQGQGRDIDTMVASAKAYINAMNKLILKRKRANDSKSVFQTSNEKLNKHVI